MKNMNAHQQVMDEYQAESFIGLDYTLSGGNGYTVKTEDMVKTDLNLRELQDAIEGKMNTARQVIMAYLVGANGSIRGPALDERQADAKEMADRLAFAFEALTHGVEGVNGILEGITARKDSEDFEKGVNEGMTASE